MPGAGRRGLAPSGSTAVRGRAKARAGSTHRGYARQIVRRTHIVAVSIATALCATLLLAGAAQAYIYWGQEIYGHGIGRAALDGSGVNSEYIPSGGGTYAFTRGVATDGTDLFWGNDLPGSSHEVSFTAPAIARQHLPDLSVNQAFTGATGQTLTGLALGGGYIYWTSNSQDTSEVGRTPAIGGQQFQSITSVFGQPNPHTCGVAVDEKYVYWANRETESIGRAELANFGTGSQVVEGDWLPLPDIPGQISYPCGVAVDAAHVYWGINEVRVGGNVEAGTTIGRADKADGSGATNDFLGGGNHVSGLTIAGPFLYWSNAAGGIPGHGSIGRGNVDGSGFQEAFIAGLDVPFGVAVDGGGPSPAPPASGGGGGGYVPPLNVGCNGCTSPSPGPTPPRPDFSRVWTNHATFAPAPWSTPLVVGKPGPTHSLVRASSAPDPRSAGGGTPTGTTFNYILDHAAKVSVAIKPKGKKALATLTRFAKAGKNELPFSGRIKGKALRPGPYVAVFVAGTGKLRSKPALLAFRVTGG